MPYVLTDDNNIIKIISDSKIHSEKYKSFFVSSFNEDILGHKAVSKKQEKIKIAIICNWNDACGISTYTQYLVYALVFDADIKIFSEISNNRDEKYQNINVVQCWERGKSMIKAVKAIKEWNPDLVLIQHEFGIFPSASYFLTMIQELSDFPYVVTLHSVYQHLDKTISTSAIKNVVVHSKEAKDNLIALGHKNQIFVIPHGCVEIEGASELWNCFQTPYTMVQFGFGFFYKGVDRAIDALAYLKRTDKKFENIFYCYLCSESPHSPNTHHNYYEYLTNKIKELDVVDNVAIIRKYHSEQIINNYLRTSKLALFPYVSDPKNVVYGASGAIRIAMANHIPVIASESHMFDDLEGVVPRPNDYLSLAKEIDEVFSNESYRMELKNKASEYINKNNWDITAKRYLEVIKKVIKSENYVNV
jgi:glycosyltransferase involved in cell wall biosynthesis